MKTAIIPQVRVESRLRADLDAVLAEGETLSAFVEESVRRSVELRQVQRDFYARGEASWQDYQRNGVSFAAEEVHAELRAMSAARRKQLGL